MADADTPSAVTTADDAGPAAPGPPAADSRLRVRQLQAQLNHHSALYYAGKPEIPDGDFDALMVELTALEAVHPELVHPGSPTQFVGAPPDTAAFARVPHSPPMMSLHNALDLDELRAWNERVHRALVAAAGSDAGAAAAEPAAATDIEASGTGGDPLPGRSFGGSSGSHC